MKYNPAKHHRRSIRLKGHDYAASGAYFVTICAQYREHIFGKVVNTAMQLNQYGNLVIEEWHALPVRFGHIELDAFVLMPNHAHCIIQINDPRRGAVPAPHAAPNDAPDGPPNDAPDGPPNDAPDGVLNDVPASRGGETPPNDAPHAAPNDAPDGPPNDAPNDAPDGVLNDVPASRGGETPPLRRETLGQIVAYFKYQTTKRINALRQTPGVPVWQRNYYEHIIRNERELNAIRRYIQNNPSKWAHDRDNVHNVRRLPPAAHVNDYLAEADQPD